MICIGYVHCTLYRYPTVYTVHCTVSTVQDYIYCTLTRVYSVHCTLYNIHASHRIIRNYNA